MFEPAPLVDIPEAPVPPGAEPEWFIGAGGAKLRAALFPAEGPVRGSVVLSGGRTEPIEKYFETIQDLTARGFVVLAHDWRGQGLSARGLPDRLRGHARGYKTFLEDFRRLLNAYEARLPKPWVALGHSMGGCLTLLALAHGEKRFASAVLSAPMLGLKFGKYSVATAGAVAGLLSGVGAGGGYMLGQPGTPFDDSFEGNALTHDETRFSRHRAQIRENPDLALGAPTWGWLDFAIKAMAYLARPANLRGVTIPVEIVSAGEEKIVDNTAQAAAVRNLPQGRLITVPGAYHEILMETDDMRNIFLRVFDALTGKTAPKPAEAPKPAAAAAPAPAAAAEAPKPAAAPTAAAPAPAPAAAAPAPAAAKPAPAKKPAAKKAAAPKAAAAPKLAAAPKASAKPAAKKAAAPKAPAAPKPAAAAKPAAKPAAKAAAPKPAAAPAKAAALKAAAPKPAAAPKAAVAKKAAAAKPVAAKAAAPKVAAPKADVAPKPAAAAKPAAAPKKVAAAKPAAKPAAAPKKPEAPKAAAPKPAAAKPAPKAAAKPAAAKKAPAKT